jgi:hypothetical protein
LLDIQTLDDSLNFPQFLLLNHGAKFYYFKKSEFCDSENKAAKLLQLFEYNLSKKECSINNEAEFKRISKVKDYKIKLPSIFHEDLDDLEYQFMIDATPGSQ